MSALKVILPLSALALFLASASSAVLPTCEKPLLYFDLGNTLLKTDFDSTTKQIKTVNYFPNVKGYLSRLKKSHFKIGLIVNIPESWGKTREAKVTALKAFVKNHWVGSTPMDWTVFDLGILVPENESQRKPAPHLFLEALAAAKKVGCPAIYQGESQREVIAANGVGLHAYEIVKSMDLFKSLLTVEQLSRIQNR